MGYSQQCLLARGSVLKRAVETLLDPQVRGGRARCKCNRLCIATWCVRTSAACA